MLAAAAGALLWSSAVSRAQESASPAPLAASGESAGQHVVLDDFIRYAEDDSSSRLELAVRSYRREDGTVVDLVGVVHIADQAYYQELNRRLAGYDVVLYELVGDPADLSGKAGKDDSSEGGGSRPGISFLRILYDAVGRFLHLSFQLQHIDYSGDHFVHADVTHEEFSRLQREQGESFATLFARAMEIQSGEAGRRSADELAQFNIAKLLLMFTSPQAVDEFKSVLARMMARTEEEMARAEKRQATVILTRRNEVAVSKLREVLGRSPAPARIAIFYGAGHMPGIGRDLREELGFREDGAVWLAAWTMPRHGDPAPAGRDHAAPPPENR